MADRPSQPDTARPVALPPPLQARGAEWYYAEGGKRVGPLTWPELQRLAAVGQLQPTDQVWRAGATTWVALAEAQEHPTAPSPAPARGAGPAPPSEEVLAAASRNLGPPFIASVVLVSLGVCVGML